MATRKPHDIPSGRAALNSGLMTLNLEANP